MKKGLLVIAAMFCMLLIPGKVQASATTVEMQRLYNPNSGEHFYTADVNEKNSLMAAGWQYEGIGWTAPEKSETPVYRLYNANAGDHHYTMSEDERSTLKKAGWKDEGIGWYSDDFQTIPLYRQYNPNAVAGSHNYTVDKAENDSLVAAGWNAEGIGWYGTTAEVISEDMPVIVEQGTTCSYSKYYGVNVVNIGAKVCNPNSSKNMKDVTLLWTAYDSHGGLLDSKTLLIKNIVAGETIAVGADDFYWKNEIPSSYNILVQSVGSFTSSTVTSSLSFAISNLRESDTAEVSGVINNNSGKSVWTCISVLYYNNGVLVGGAGSDKYLSAGVNTFTVNPLYNVVPEHDSIVVEARNEY